MSKKSKFSNWLSYLGGPVPDAPEKIKEEEAALEKHNLECALMQDTETGSPKKQKKKLEYEHYANFIAQKRKQKLDDVYTHLNSSENLNLNDNADEDIDEINQVADAIYMMNAGLIKDTIDKSKLNEDQLKKLQDKLDADKKKMDAHKSEREKQFELIRQHMAQYDAEKAKNDKHYEGFSWKKESKQNDAEDLMYNDFLVRLDEEGIADQDEHAVNLRKQRYTKFQNSLSKKKK